MGSFKIAPSIPHYFCPPPGPIYPPTVRSGPVPSNVAVVVNFLFQLIFIFPLFWGMVMYANEFKTKEKQKLTEIKN